MTIFSYLVGFKDNHWTPLGIASVDNLEDVIGGHIWIGCILIVGGVWHIIVQPFAWVRRILPIENGEEILSYSLLGLALMAWISASFVGYNTTVFPPELYGTERLGMANIQFFLGILAFLGYVWHAWRARNISF
jgi:photosystem II CP43 chlorophyll apoprotein